MGLSYKPEFRLMADGRDITDLIHRDLVSLTLTDKAGSESDQLVFTIAAKDTPAPKRGAVLRLALGFNGWLVNKGTFVVDKVQISGPPRKIQVTAKAAPMDGGKQPAQLQTQKTRSWDDITLGDLVGTIAGEHGLIPRVGGSLAGMRIKHIDQTNESDMALLTRLAGQYGAVSKPANGYWIFVPEGAGRSVSGGSLQVVTLTPEMVSRYDFSFSSRNSVKRVTATYYDAETGETGEVSTGAGDPALNVAFQYPNRQEAEAAVAARAKSVTSGSDTMNISMGATPGLLSMVAEGHVNASGFGDQEDGKWRIKSVEFSLSGSGLQIRIGGDHGATE